ncbi:hypothetical protein [Amycolatopsis thailandensis]|uniref:Uncharacterized protein n=1 Tax=Amycolatopsis thailandensis TaxID=589330 RepID=A0A229SAS9_9PSEU|nr:hypothetical protein [Amycolatopsis thailandensis]OXM55970.1 hypothetical protein CFP71_15930 [Amycolatopsis thailandensis]
MKKTLGRLAGAVLAGAVISLAVTPVAMAQTETTTEPPAAPTETSASVPPGPTYTGGPVTTAPPETSTPTSSSSQQPTPTSGKPSETSGKPTPTKTSSPTPTPTEEPKPDFTVGAGYIDPDGIGALAVICASEPTGVTAADFEILESFEDGSGTYTWIYIVQVKPGFKGKSSTFTWTCDGKPGQGDIEFEETVGGGATAPGAKVKKQVKLKPKGGIETGFGATAA